MIDGEMIGQASLLRKLAKAGERAQAAVDKRAEKIANDMADAIRRRAPVDKGDLRDSVRVEPGDEPGTFEVKAGGTPATTKPTGKRRPRASGVGWRAGGGQPASAGGHEFDTAVMVNFGTQKAPANPFFSSVVNEFGPRIRRELGDEAAQATIEILED